MKHTFKKLRSWETEINARKGSLKVIRETMVCKFDKISDCETNKREKKKTKIINLGQARISKDMKQINRF